MKNQTLAARRAAHQALFFVLNECIPLEAALARAFDNSDMADRRDRAFAQNIVLTTLRNLGHIKRLVDAKLHKPIPNHAADIEIWLWLGATQILFMDVPDHAAVDTSVEAARRSKRSGGNAFARLTNAVLRSLAREKQALLAHIQGNPVEALPDWLTRRWRRHLGAPKLEAMARILRSQPPLDLTVACAKTRERLLELEGARSFGPHNVRLNWKGPIEDIPGYKNGKWWVQDLAASLPVSLLDVRREHTVLDLCAAPGGKTLQLAALGAKVVALDKSAKRLLRLEDNLRRTGFKAEIIAADLEKWRPLDKPERILLDAPCSATGTLRRNPDIPWSKSEAHILSLAAHQARFLKRSFGWLAEGGRLVYCVCSMEPEEGPAVIRTFLERTPNAKLSPLSPQLLPENLEAGISEPGMLLTDPSFLAEEGGVDGFFIACLEKFS